MRLHPAISLRAVHDDYSTAVPWGGNGGSGTRMYKYLLQRPPRGGSQLTRRCEQRWWIDSFTEKCTVTTQLMKSNFDRYPRDVRIRFRSYPDYFLPQNVHIYGERGCMSHHGKRRISLRPTGAAGLNLDQYTMIPDSDLLCYSSLPNMT